VPNSPRLGLTGTGDFALERAGGRDTQLGTNARAIARTAVTIAGTTHVIVGENPRPRTSRGATRWRFSNPIQKCGIEECGLAAPCSWGGTMVSAFEIVRTVDGTIRRRRPDPDPGGAAPNPWCDGRRIEKGRAVFRNLFETNP